MAGKVDLVTVVFGPELPLLELQARSLARFFDPEAVGRILVVVNDFHEEPCAAAVEAMRPRYGCLADRLEVVRPDRLRSELRLGWLRRAERWYVAHGRGPLMRRLPRRDRLASGWRGNPGWSMQQAQKLLVANSVTAPHVLILDAKNFFIAPVGFETFFTTDGRARSRRVPLSDRQREWVLAAFRALGLSAAGINEAPPTVTPVALESGLMREAVAELERRLGPLEVFFSLYKGRVSEFMLLFAGIDRGLGRWWDRLADGLPESRTVFAKGGDQEVLDAIALTHAGKSPLMGLHRRVVWRIGNETRAALVRFWMDLGLFASSEEALAVFAGAKR